MKGTIEVSIRDEYQVFVAKLKHDNFYNPHELVVLKNTIGQVTSECNDMGEYRLVSDGLFPPDRTWVAKPSALGNKNVNVGVTDEDGRFVELNIEDHLDLNGYMDIEIRVYPEPI